MTKWLNYRFICLILACLGNSAAIAAVGIQQNILLDKHLLHYAEWQGDTNNDDKPVVLMLSGPSDTWHSDSAWWAGLAPKLAKKFRVIALDRAGQVNGIENAPVGYQHFSIDLHLFIEAMQLYDLTIVSFASANNALNLYLSQYPDKVKKVIMIDPDVLSPYSINRYKKDAQPFVDNKQDYLAYVAAGKYTARVEQKNVKELTHIKSLVGDDTDMDWQYLKSLFDKRLEIQNQLNMFREIAIYGNDLDAASAVIFPQQIPLVIIDTQFEQVYIDASDDEEDRQELQHWQADAKSYYQSQIKAVTQGRYIEVLSHEHLFQYAEPQSIIDLIETSF